MKLTKIIALVSAAALITAALAGCSSAGSSEAASSEAASSEAASSEAASSEAASSETAGSDVTYQNDVFSLVYNDAAFYALEEENGVQLSYQGEAAGSNVVEVTVTDFATKEDALASIPENDYTDPVELDLNGYSTLMVTTKTDDTAASSSEATSGLQLCEYFYAVENNGTIVLIDVLNTVEPDEANSYAISDSISAVLDTFAFNA